MYPQNTSKARPKVLQNLTVPRCGMATTIGIRATLLSVHTMQAACLPVDNAQPAQHTTAKERAALLSLLGRQLAGGQAAIAAEAAERRQGGASSNADASR